MLNANQSRICPKRNTLRHLRKPLRSMIFVKKDRQSRLLLAIHTSGCQRIRPILWQVPTVRQPTSLTTRRTDANNGTLAIRAMGVRHHGTIPNRKASAQIPSNRNWLLHQMSGSGTTSNYNWEEHLEFRMEGCDIQIRNTMSACLW